MTPLANRQYRRVELAPEDLVIDIFVVRRDPSPVRVTHRRTRLSVIVHDQPTTQANRDVAVERLSELLGDAGSG